MATGIVNLRDSIYQEAMRYAKMHNVSLESFVENIIINTINRDKHSSKKFKLKSLMSFHQECRVLLALDM